MGRFQTNSSSTVTIFYLVTLAATMMLMLPECLAVIAAEAPRPVSNPFLQDCRVKIAICGPKIFKNIVMNATVSTNCCHRLMYMGKPCHEGLVTHLISLPFYKDNKAQLLVSAQLIWNYCISVPF